MNLDRTSDRHYTAMLCDLIITKRSESGQIVTHDGSIEDAPELLATLRSTCR